MRSERLFRARRAAGTRRSATLLSLSLAAILLPAPSRLAAAEAGTQESAPGKAAPATVEQLVAQADEFVRKGSIFDAITALGKAVEAAPARNDLRLRLAVLMKQRGMWLRSAEHYSLILDSEPKNIAARLGYGELLLAEYQFRSAAEEFRRVLDVKTQPDERDRALVGLGNAQFGMGSYSEAADTYRLLLARRPDEPSALAFLNIALGKMGDLDGAIEGWNRFLAKQPDLLRARIHLTELEELRGAIVRQRQAAAAQPGEAGVQQRLGDLLMRQPDLEGAVQAYRAASTAAPADAGLRLKLGAALRDRARLAEAATEFRVLAQDADLGITAGYNLAYCARRMGDAAGETSAWRGVLQGNPRDGYAYRRYLGALAGSGGGEKEIDLLLRAIEERPSDPLPRIQYAVLARHVGREDEGIRALLDALSVEPNDPGAQTELHAALALRPRMVERLLAEIDASGADPALSALRKGEVLLAAGRPAEAETHFAAAAAARPSDVKAAIALVLCRRARGAPPAETAEALRRERDRAPSYLYARLDLAVTLQSLSAFTEAAAEAEQALKLAPDHPVALATLGASLRGIGGEENLARARVALRRAVRMDPMDQTGAVRFLLAKVAWEMGREDEARSILKGDLPVEPEEMYRLAWESVRDSYHDRSFNGQDWNAWRDRFRGKLETQADALSAIALMLASLDNRDTRLRSADQTASLFFTQRSSRVQRDAVGRTALGSRTVESSVLEGNVGYLTVTNMSDPKLVNEVRSAVAGMKERDGVIVDLRGNPGGSERDVEEIASMFVRPGTPTGTIITPAGTAGAASHGGAPPLIPDRPVVVLVDRNTGSSAEALAGALKESKRAVIVGEHTYGKAGIQLPRLLPDGTILLVAAGENADVEGKAYTGVGVAPDVQVEGAMPASDPNGDAALQKAREILVRERGKRRNLSERAPGP